MENRWTNPTWRCDVVVCTKQLTIVPLVAVAVLVAWYTSGLGYLMSVIMAPQNSMVAAVAACMILGGFLNGVEPKYRSLSPVMKRVIGEPASSGHAGPCCFVSCWSLLRLLLLAASSPAARCFASCWSLLHLLLVAASSPAGRPAKCRASCSEQWLLDLKGFQLGLPDASRL